MEDDNFLDEVQGKIERLTGRTVGLFIDESNSSRLEVDLNEQIPKIQMGSAVLQYPGFARMCIEYAVVSINRGRQVGALEFHMVLGRN